MTNFTYRNYEEFINKIESKDYELSKAVIDVIFENYTNIYSEYFIVDIKIVEQRYNIHVSLEKKDFLEALYFHLPVYEREENYEDCEKIIKIIKYLENEK